MTKQRKWRRPIRTGCVRSPVAVDNAATNSVYIGETGTKFSTRAKEHAKPKAKRDDKSLFVKHCNDEGHFSEAAEQKFGTLYKETSARRRKVEDDWKFSGRKRKENKFSSTT